MTATPHANSADNLYSRAIPLAGMVAVQPGAVVSRTVVSKPVGTVTVFAFDQGQGLSTHSAPYDALVWILEGEAEIAIDGQPLQAKTGDMVLMPANRPHALNALRPFKMALVMIKE